MFIKLFSEKQVANYNSKVFGCWHVYENIDIWKGWLFY